MATIFNKFYNEKTAIINPTDIVKRAENFPEICVSTFSKKIIDKYAAMEGVEIIAELVTANGTLPVYKIRYQKQEIAFYLSLVGAPACASELEEVIAIGAKNIVLFGSCGILDDSIKEEIIVPVAAVRDEGTSYHYIPAQDEIEADRKYVDSLISCLDKCGYPYRIGKSWTTDGIYRETAGILADRRRQGCIAVEMELAAALAVTKFREVPFIQFLYGADCLANDTWEIRDLNAHGFDQADKLMALAFACGIALSKTQKERLGERR